MVAMGNIRTGREILAVRRMAIPSPCSMGDEQDGKRESGAPTLKEIVIHHLDRDSTSGGFRGEWTWHDERHYSDHSVVSRPAKRDTVLALRSTTAARKSSSACRDR